jgi:hypothetical protein
MRIAALPFEFKALRNLIMSIVRASMADARPPAEDHLRRDALDRRARRPRLLRGPSLQPFDRGQPTQMPMVMVMEELALLIHRPVNGPIIVSE